MTEVDGGRRLERRRSGMAQGALHQVRILTIWYAYRPGACLSTFTTSCTALVSSRGYCREMTKIGRIWRR
jgi:hypothetical protein